MKKLVVRISIGIVALIILVVLAVHFFLDAGIKRGVEGIGPRLTKVAVKLDAVNLSLLSGAGSLKGLLVGNPEGFSSPSAIQVGSASLALAPSSLLSDKVVIRSVRVESPDITFETDLKGNNLKKILANLDEATGGSSQPAAQSKETKASKKLEVDDFLITGGRIHLGVTGLGAATVPLPEIHFTNLGAGQDGITAADLIRKVLGEIEKDSAQEAGKAVTSLAKGAEGLSQAGRQSATNAVQSITKGLGGLLNRR